MYTSPFYLHRTTTHYNIILLSSDLSLTFRLEFSSRRSTFAFRKRFRFIAKKFIFFIHNLPISLSYSVFTAHLLDPSKQSSDNSNTIYILYIHQFTMIGVLAIVFAVQATAVLAGGARYPSGLNPALCPNYPHCDNALLAAYAQPAAGNDYNDHYTNNNNNAGQYYGSGYQSHPSEASNYHNNQPLVPAPYTEPGYPAGLSSSNCPNYPYCSHQVPAEALRYAHKRYPSGVSPQNCPNYPYCH